MASDPTFKGNWRKLHEEILADIDSPTETDRRLADRLVKNLRAAENAIDLADAEPLVEGSTGQLTEHPGYKIAARCERAALAIGRQLGVFDQVSGRPPRSGARSNLQAVEQGLKLHG